MSAPAGPRVSVDKLARSFAGVPAVREVSFTVGAGEIHALCGHNGAGKSTVVKMLSGQLAPDAGRILLDGEPVGLRSRQAAQRLGVALVDQELSVVPALTVLENMSLGDIDAPLIVRRRAAAARCREVLDDMGLERLRPDQLVSTLSMGERQLVEIAKALSQRARVVILDEPTATLSDVGERAGLHRRTPGRRPRLRGRLRVAPACRRCSNSATPSPCCATGGTSSTSPAADLTVESLIVHMLGEAPRRLEATRRPDPDLTHALRIEQLRVPGRLEDFALTARAGRIYALAGQLGSGASDVLRALAGLHPRATGRVELRERAVPFRSPVGAARSRDRLRLQRPQGRGPVPGQVGRPGTWWRPGWVVSVAAGWSAPAGSGVRPVARRCAPPCRRPGWPIRSWR